MQADAGVVGDGLQDVPDHRAGEVPADEMVNEGFGLPVVDQVGPPRHVDDGLGQSLVQGHEGIAEAPDSALIA